MQGKLLGSDLRAEGVSLGNGRQIANQARLTQLAYAGGQVLVAPLAHVGKAMNPAVLWPLRRSSSSPG